MDLLTTRAIEVTKLALDGLIMRNDAINSNTANIMTPDYQRKEISFEHQLKEIIEKDDLRQYIKEQNSVKYEPNSVDLLMSTGDKTPRGLTVQQARFLQSNNYNDFAPQITNDMYSGADSTGNNVELEKEMLDAAKLSSQYIMLSNLEQKQFRTLNDIIKGQSS